MCSGLTSLAGHCQAPAGLFTSSHSVAEKHVEIGSRRMLVEDAQIELIGPPVTIGGTLAGRGHGGFAHHRASGLFAYHRSPLQVGCTPEKDGPIIDNNKNDYRLLKKKYQVADFCARQLLQRP